MYIIDVPPFIEIAPAETEEQLAQMTRSLLFVKPARSGSRLQSVLDLYDRWAEEVILRPMKASVISSQEDKPLSRSVIAEFVGNIIKEFKE